MAILEFGSGISGEPASESLQVQIAWEAHQKDNQRDDDNNGVPDVHEIDSKAVSVLNKSFKHWLLVCTEGLHLCSDRISTWTLPSV